MQTLVMLIHVTFKDDDDATRMTAVLQPGRLIISSLRMLIGLGMDIG